MEIMTLLLPHLGVPFQSSPVDGDFSVVDVPDQLDSLLLVQPILGGVSDALSADDVITSVLDFVILESELLFVVDDFTYVVAYLIVLNLLHQNVGVVVGMLAWCTIKLSYLRAALLNFLIPASVILGYTKVDSVHLILILS